jgi:hypothetical protein
MIRRRKAFLTAMAELLRRRRALQGSLQALSHPEGSIAGLSTDYLRTADVVQRMQQNLDKDHSLVRRFTGGIIHQVREAAHPPISHQKPPWCKSCLLLMQGRQATCLTWLCDTGGT